MKVLAQHAGRSFSAYHADTVEFTTGIPNNSIDFSVYSPPYGNLYIFSESERDMGNVEDDSVFFRCYDYLVREKFRITRPGRLTAIHVKDRVFYSTSSARGDRGLSPFSDRCVASHLAAGWTFHSRVTIWRDPVKEMRKTKADRLLFKNFRADAARSSQGLPEYLLVFRCWKIGMESTAPVVHDYLRWREWRGADLPAGVTESIAKRDLVMSKEWESDSALSLWQQWASPVWMDTRETDVLNVKVVRDDKAEKHLTPMPLDLTRRALALWSNPGDTVFSAFMGIGSEGYASLRDRRKFIGVELKPEYFEQACNYLDEAERLGPASDLMANMTMPSPLVEQEPVAPVHTPERLKFLKDIEKLYKKHNLSISHEDTHGGFKIEPFSQNNLDWLRETSAILAGAA